MSAGPIDANSRRAADAAVDLALERQRQGHHDHARKLCLDVVRRFPRHARALLCLGVTEQAAGRLREALQLISQSVAIDSSNPDAHCHIGHLFLHAGDPERARQAFETAVALAPEHAAAVSALAKMSAVAGDMRAATPLIEKLIAMSPNKVEQCLEFAELMIAMGRYDNAIALLKRALEFGAENAVVHNNLAACYDQKGCYTEAVEHFEHAIRIDPTHAKSMASLISLPAYEPSSELLRQARQLAQKGATDPAAAAKLHGAIGKHADRCGAFAEAFDHFTRANILTGKVKPPFDTSHLKEFFSRLIAAFDSISQPRPAGLSIGIRPVFIVGMPRSGTSLVEQIIASHPSAHGAGELQEIPKLVSSLGQDYPENFKRISSEHLAMIRRRYLETVQAKALYDEQIVTDKLPLNFMHLGVIAALFPDARIIHCRRDPIDVGLSCYIENFDMPQDFSTTFENFALFYEQYERLMAHWRRVLTIPIYEVQYERLVQEQESETRKLISFCGLAWSDNCLAFAETQRVVATPSRWQGRQPLYHTAVGRWKNYETELQPLIRLLRASGPAF